MLKLKTITLVGLLFLAAFLAAAQTNETGLLEESTVPTRLHLSQAGTNGGIEIELTAPVPGHYVLESSGDLVRWRPITTNMLVERSLKFRDLTAGSSDPRFYRAHRTDEAPYVPGQILVQFKADAPETGVQTARAFAGLVNWQEIRTPAMEAEQCPEFFCAHTTLSVNEAVERLRADPNVEHAEPNYIVSGLATPDDPLFFQGLWGMYGDTSSPSNPFGSQAAEAWAQGYTGSRQVVVGVIDTGIQVTHPDLRENIWTNPFEVPGNGRDDDGNGYVDDVYGWDFYHRDSTVFDGVNEHFHGTHVAGTIGAVGGNGRGVVGVNWNIKLISGKFLGPDGHGDTAGAIAAVDYFTDLKRRHGVNIVALNNSWGGSGYSRFLHEAILRAAKASILFVASAGNDGRNTDFSPTFPACYDTRLGTPFQSPASYDAVIAVASIDAGGKRATSSNYGERTVDLGAPGVVILSTMPGDRYGYASGTSMAAPHVCGAAALYAAAHPNASAEEIRAAILRTTEPTPSLAGNTVTAGRLKIDRTGERPRWPDLVIRTIEIPDAVVQFQSIRGRILVCNEGTGTASGTVQVGLGLSLDRIPQNGNDIPLGVIPIVLDPPLQTNGCRWYSFDTAPIGNAWVQTQYLIAGVDFGFAVPELNENNNVTAQPVRVEAPYWDLRFEIVNAPSLGYRCNRVSWGVKVTNAGNVLSDDVCFISGIGANRGAGNWANNLGLFFGWSGRLAPGASTVIPVSNYNIWCNAWAQTQYIKAEVNYSNGCRDFETAGNYSERGISIR